MTHTKQNLIFQLTNNIHSDQVPFTYKIIINSLTSLVGASLINHISYPDDDGSPPTLDKRNEQDENSRGDDANDEANENFGITLTPMKSYNVALIADGIRQTMYEELFAFGEYEKAEALVYSIPFNLNSKINYGQPMSLQTYMQFRVEAAGKVDEHMVRLGVASLDEPAEIIRASLTEMARVKQAKLKSITPDVLVEANSMNNTNEIGDFTLFDIITQCKIAEKLSTKFSAEYMRILPRAITNLSVASDLNMVKSQHRIVKDWILANDGEFKQAMLHRAAA